MATQFPQGCYRHLGMTGAAQESWDRLGRSLLTRGVQSHMGSSSLALCLGSSALTSPQIHTYAVQGGFLQMTAWGC